MSLLSEWTRLKAQLDAQDAKVLQRLIDAYGTGYERVMPDIDVLIEYLVAQLAAGKITSSMVKNSAAYKSLIAAIEDELTGYQGYLRAEIATAATAAGKAGLSSGNFLMLVALADAMGLSVSDVPRDILKSAPPDALAFLADYLRRDGPLFAKINALSGFHAEQIAAGILERVGEGMNPATIARWIEDAYGMGLTDSMRMCRTVQLYSYRQANAAVQMANSDVLQGLVWCAELDDVTCDSCIALHGQVFDVGTICDDHHNGRCALLPWVIGAPSPIEQTGEDWFNAQDEKTQKNIMGEGKWQAWSDGKFEFSQLSTTYEDDVFGTMRGSSTLGSLLGEE
jgi:hypothetical protein